MKREINLKAISVLVLSCVIGAIVITMIVSMMQFSERTLNDMPNEQIQKAEEVIRKAAVQCFALEGEYPMDVEYLATYGVKFEKEKFLYHYEWVAGNLPPNVMVFPLDGGGGSSVEEETVQ